ncbi:MAG: aminotransferase class I/II-fold pyridoxal phosphate-dependent enzyme [Immundisolibacter sp.]|nr:aminotransferase class I/II-fold pyridoxal phosphate-dependent enzyme [Immundisolibacter sp.]MDD3650132.1 aminotransferase class I/II-fold pyridoxal phosphate-dependent enzyme [Immundisolibacter sp.]
MGLFDKLASAAAVRRDVVSAGGLVPFGVTVERILSPTEGIVAGRQVILGGTNNYLGLTFDHDCIEAGIAALRREGTGTTGSRMANGSYAGHLALERELAAFYGWPEAIVFSTGYLANLGMIGALTGPGDVLVIDSDCHASIYDGCKLSGAEVIRFRHNNAADLDRRLARLGERAHNALVIVEGIYSMLGDQAPLADIVAAKKRHGAMLMVDEAHSLGVLGEHGRGLCEAAGVMDGVDFVVGTFSKSLGGVGGFCVSPHPEFGLVRYTSRPYIFTASPSPATIASTRQALGHLRSRPQLRERLWHNVSRLHQGLTALGLPPAAAPSPVLAIARDSREQALADWQQLLDAGVYVNLMVPPATPGGISLLRCSISAAHSDAQIDHILAAFAALPGGRSAAPGQAALA